MGTRSPWCTSDGAGLRGRATAAPGTRFAVVVARFNDFFTRPLLEGALAVFRRDGADEALVDVAWVPGSFETGVVAKRLAASGRYGAVVCLGPLSGGRRPTSITSPRSGAGVARASLDTGVPVIFGIITTDDPRPGDRPLRGESRQQGLRRRPSRPSRWPT